MTDFKALYENLNPDFCSGAHTIQNRLFGFTTTNIRHIGILCKYLDDLVPQYESFGQDYTSWKDWCYQPDIQEKHKQKFMRLEQAKLLWRDVSDNPSLNTIGVELYNIYKRYGKEYLEVVLYLYVLTGRYWNVNNQPVVGIQKILHAFEGDIDRDYQKILENKSEESKLFLTALFYNPQYADAMDIAFGILESTNAQEYSVISEKIVDKNEKIESRFRTNGGKGNFEKDALVIYNYSLFQNNTVDEYINAFIDRELYTPFSIHDKPDTIKKKLSDIFQIIENKNILQELEVEALLEDETDYIVPIKSTKSIARKSGIKEQVFRAYDYKCFFENHESQDMQGWHDLAYFYKKDGMRYIEAHHLIPMKNSRFFTTSLDVAENILPLCPNCHRKIHHATDSDIKDMLDKAYVGIKEDDFIKKGIFISKHKLYDFYGISND